MSVTNPCDTTARYILAKSHCEEPDPQTMKECIAQEEEEGSIG